MFYSNSNKLLPDRQLMLCNLMQSINNNNTKLAVRDCYESKCILHNAQQS